MKSEAVICAVLDHLNEVPSLVNREALPGLLARLKSLLQRILAAREKDELSSLTVELVMLCREYPLLRQTLRHTTEKHQGISPAGRIR